MEHAKTGMPMLARSDWYKSGGVRDSGVMCQRSRSNGSLINEASVVEPVVHLNVISTVCDVYGIFSIQGRTELLWRGISQRLARYPVDQYRLSQ